MLTYIVTPFLSSICSQFLTISHPFITMLPTVPKILSALVLSTATVSSQTVSPLVISPCSPWNMSTGVVCINHYSSVMPIPFFRKLSEVITEDTYASTSVPSDPSFKLVGTANFLVFDQAAALDILGPNPSLDFIFPTSPYIHEGPVYVPSLNKIYVTQLQQGYLPQLVIDLNVSPPTLTPVTADPPLYLPTGSAFHNGLIYYSTIGNGVVGNQTYYPGIYTLDPTTGKSQVLLNNYFGYYFNGCDDMAIDPSTGDVWFTDNCKLFRSTRSPPSLIAPFTVYAWGENVSSTPPQIEAASYRFRPSTGAVNLVEDSLLYPNGIAFSPDHKTLYITDTAAGSGPYSPDIPSGILTYNDTGKRTVYAYKVATSGTTITNKRAVYRAQDYTPDGLKIAQNGYIVTATGHGVDVLDQAGTLLIRIQTNYTAVNIVWAGKDFEDLWIVGAGGISRVRWGLKG